MSRRLGNALILVALVVLVAVSLVLGTRNSSGDEEKFVGSDSIAADAIEQTGHEPWFQPLFTPGSGEIESGLFALQAAIGAGVLGYCLGRLHGRRRPAHDTRAVDPVDSAGVVHAVDPVTIPEAPTGPATGSATP